MFCDTDTLVYMIVGIDEVGRGCLAGPVTVAAVLLGDHTIQGLTDSKLLTKKKRAALEGHIKHQALGIGIGWISAKQIDEIGISAALKIAAESALAQIYAPFEEIIVDGTIRLVADTRATTLKKADQLIASVSAASIIAKEARDRYMRFTDELFPEYGFANHVGYGTAAHLAALRAHGPSPLHRLSFAPLASAKPAQTQRLLSDGAKAEAAAAEFLEREGYEILERNWKTRWCEIDIIARKGQVVRFVEVKYRRGNRQGVGLDYITPSKQKQMRFAAELWLARMRQFDSCTLAALQVSGSTFAVSAWLPDIDEA